ncbi:uncharacterized protein LOC110182793 isoform X2 [Drosophila serrata]|uniref:uncharacterized protein LOC110182793 isoform X2 n=1 Tax=Drosophila serrata TaxID=7274 RepID=UPI000A1D207D|nr:uncharacterized protein LOC110182793 isoform X2 [Drosophila serrata]
MQEAQGILPDSALLLYHLPDHCRSPYALNTSLKKSGDCFSQSQSGKSSENIIFDSKSEYTRRVHETNYNQFQKRIEAQSVATGAVIRAQALRNLTEVLKGMQGAKPLLEELRDELPIAKGLASRFRNALSAVKQNLKVFLTSQCSHQECGDFFRDNKITMLDEGCLHYEKLPPTEDFTKSIEKYLASNFVNYPLLAAQRIAKVIRNPMDNLVVKKDLHKGTKKVPLIGLRLNENQTMREDKPKDSNSSPAAALKGKMGRTWYRTTLGWLILLLFLPILLLIGVLVTLFSCRHARRMLCAFMIAAIILFALNIILLLFFLVHGALAHQIFCSGKSGGSKMFFDPLDYLPELRSGDPLQRCARNESLYRVLAQKELYGKKNVRESLEKVMVDPMFDNLVPQAAFVNRELFESNLFSYNSSHFTRHMCRELVPEPRPGPLPALIGRLDNLTRSVGSSPFLLNQTSYLRAAHKELGQPLAAIVQRLLDKLKKLDHLLTSGYGSFARYMSRVLEKIKQVDLSGDAGSYFLDSGLDNSTRNALESCAPQTRQYKLDMDRNVQFEDYCKRIANPMNAIWFWLLLFTLLLLPALCCSNYLRRRLRCCRHASQDTLVSCCGDNFVAHSALPLELESHCRCYRYLPVCSETNCDQMLVNNCCEHHC